MRAPSLCHSLVLKADWSTNVPEFEHSLITAFIGGVQTFLGVCGAGGGGTQLMS